MALTMRGERALSVIWVGQVISALGSSLTGFGLSIYMFDKTGSISMQTSLQFAGVAPQVYLSLFAGIVIDMVGAKRVMAVATLAGALISAVLAIALALGDLSIWLVLAGVVANGAAAAFRDTALQTIVPAFVEAERFPTVNGRIAMGQAIPYILGPGVAVALLAFMSFELILILDACGFLLAFVTVLFVAFPPLLGNTDVLPLSARLTQGGRWVMQRPSLAWLSAFFSLSTFFNGAAGGLTMGYVLFCTGGNRAAFATVTTMFALGLLAGGSAAGPVVRRSPPLAAIAVSSGVTSLARVAFGLVSGPLAWGACQLVRAAGLTVAGAANDTIWQHAVPENWRGRVFGTRRVLNGGLYPLALGFGGVVGAIAAEGGTGRFALCFVAFGLLEGLSLVLLLPARAAGANTLVVAPAE
jgi:DHA3 family macrolide efflux protein-like MFS transporter